MSYTYYLLMNSGITPVALTPASYSLTFAHEEGVDFGHAHVGAGAERWIN